MTPKEEELAEKERKESIAKKCKHPDIIRDKDSSLKHCLICDRRFVDTKFFDIKLIK